MININSYFPIYESDTFLNIISLICLLFSSLLILLNKEFRSSRILFQVILIGLTVRIILIIYNVFINPLPGSDKDAIGFMRAARRMIMNNINPDIFVGSDLFEFILALILKYSIDNLLFIISINNIIFLVTFIFILKIFTLLNVSEKYKSIAIIILLLYPSLIFNTVTILREPLQILFLTLSIYIYIYMMKHGFKLLKFTLLYLTIFLFGILHNGLLALVPIIYLIMSFGLYKNMNGNFNKYLIIIFNLIFLSLTVTIFLTGTISSPLVDSIISGGATEYTTEYRDGSPETRASYGGTVSFSNPIVALITSFLVVFKYFFYPLPWHMTSIQDLVSLFENMMRFYFMFFIYKQRRYLKDLKYLILIFLLLEFVWALGTSNWGTASRHHIVQSQILIIVFIYLKDIKFKEVLK